MIWAYLKIFHRYTETEDENIKLVLSNMMVTQVGMPYALFPANSMIMQPSSILLFEIVAGLLFDVLYCLNRRC